MLNSDQGDSALEPWSARYGIPDSDDIFDAEAGKFLEVTHIEAYSRLTHSLAKPIVKAHLRMAANKPYCFIPPPSGAPALLAAPEYTDFA